MADIVSASKRSEMMSAIKGKNTRPEILIRSLLHAQGFRFRLHKRDLPGRPDIVLSKYRTTIFVNGCYWHGHTGCARFRLPKSNVEFWSEKIRANQMRDARNHIDLEEAGWRVLVIWECSIGSVRRPRSEELIVFIRTFLLSDQSYAEIPSI